MPPAPPCTPSPEAHSFAYVVGWQLVLPRVGILAAWWGLNAWVTLPVPLAYGLICADVLGLGWQMRRYHHSADAHVRDTGAMMATWGGYLLVLMALFASVTQWWGASLRANAPPPTESIFVTAQRARDALYSLTLAPDGESLRFEGEITYGLKARLEETLTQHPKVQRIELRSGGGHVFEARGAAQVILRHGLTTHVRDSCSSACTLMFIAGAQRSLDPGARLGFHGYALGAVHFPGYDIAKQEQKDRDYFGYRGVTPAFTDRVFDAPPDQMWFPAHAELRAQGVVTE